MHVIDVMGMLMDLVIGFTLLMHMIDMMAMVMDIVVGLKL